MLEKEPRLRPADGAELVCRLDELAASEPATGGWESPLPLDPHAAATPAEHELALVSVVVARDQDAVVRRADSQTDLSDVSPVADLVVQELATAGAMVERLIDGTLVAVLMPGEIATDQIMQAARCALRVREHLPRAHVAVATGRGALGPGLRVGDAIERAVALLPCEGGGGVRLDEVTAGLLDSRFRVAREASGPVLLGFSESMEEARSLLGRSTPFLGREREMALLMALAEECMAEPVARAALLVGEPGIGKSRLRVEFVRQLRAAHPDLLCLSGRCEEVGGAPLQPLIQALHQLGGVTPSDPPPQRRSALRARLGRHLPPTQAEETLGALGELLGVSLSEPPRSRADEPADPEELYARAAAAVIRLLRQECAHHPILLALDDVHWADADTARLLEQLLGALADSPLFLICTARPELAERFPALRRQRAVQEIRLQGLSRRASERLVSSLLSLPGESSTVASLVERSGGSPLLLEELIRAAAAGHSEELPETVLAIVQARMARLDHVQRRVLRAASVFGSVLWPSGVRALLPRVEGEAVTQALQALHAADVLVPTAESRYSGEPELRFRYAPLRAAAYGLLTEDERSRMHRAAARFLASMNETDSALLAEHHQRGGESELAASLFLRAAERLFDGYDLDGALALAERGIGCGASGAVLGGLRALCARILFWRSQLDRACALASEAVALLPAGQVSALLAICILIAGASQRRDTPELLRLAARITEADPEAPALGAYAESGGLLSILLAYCGRREEAQGLLARIESRVEQQVAGGEAGESVLARARGWTLYARGRLTLLFTPDAWGALDAGRRAAAVFEELADLRCLVLARSLEVACLFALGQTTQAASALRDTLALADGLAEAVPGSEIAAAGALGLAEQPGLRPGSDEARQAAALSTRLIEAPHATGQQRGAGSCAAAWLALAARDLPSAERAARAAVAEHAAWPLHRLTSQVALITVLHRMGEHAQAAAAADAALHALAAQGCDGVPAIRLWLAAADALQAAGQGARAQSLRAAASQRLAQLVAQAPDAEARAHLQERAERLLNGS
ncbi:MAG: AAA family ATPase [Polyangia bacterium]